MPHLAKDVQRCTGFRMGTHESCPLRYHCMRFLQYKYDMDNKQERILYSHAPIPPGAVECNQQIKITIVDAS